MLQTLVTVLMSISVGSFKNLPQAIPLEPKEGRMMNTVLPETTLYWEDFETGASGWTSIDLTATPPMWHPDTFQAYGGIGRSWWMADTSIKGYLDHWYQVLDSPEIGVPSDGSPTLTFMMNRAVENPAGAEPPYDGWDGCNVRISTDGGSSWAVLTATDPPYNCSSMYSFGFEHGEGPGIPGWGGSSGGWVQATFDLSSYKGQTVKIRWAFASDPAYCTTDDPSLFGWQIDDIDVAGVFFNDGEDTTGFSRSSIVPVGGDLWHLETAPDAPSPTHIARCSNEAGTYNNNMENFYISPLIHLPLASYIRADFMLKGYLIGSSETFPDCDYFLAQLSPDTGKTWYYVSNPTGDPTGTNYVYLLDQDQWFSFTEGYAQEIDVTYYAGQDLLFRFGVHSNAVDSTGTGVFIDDFKVFGEGVVGMAEHREEHTTLELNLACPTPFANSTTIYYQLPVSDAIALKVYNSLGQLVKTLVDNYQEAGQHFISWDGTDHLGNSLPDGIYFIHLETRQGVLSQKLTLIR